MSFVTAAIGLGSAVGGKLIDGALAGGGDSGGMAGMPAQPINNTANFGPVNFGHKFIGDSGLSGGAGVVAEQNTPAWTKALPWIVGGLVAILAIAAVIFNRGKK